MIEINDELIKEIISKAKSSPRRRTNHNFHKELDEPIQRMLNASEPGTYVRPHKHENPDKVEVFIILKGRAAIIEFDEKGNIAGHVILSPQEGSYGIEIPPRVWHSFIALEPGTVLYEVKEGPYDKDVDKNFARWAPEEGTDAAQAFNNKIIKDLKL